MIKRIVIPLLLGFAWQVAGAETLYIQNGKAALLAEPAFNGARVAAVQKGDEVEVLEKRGGWYQVKLGEQTGWMPKLMLSTRPPLKKVTVFSGEESGELLKQKARRRASNATTAGAARGLTEDARQRASRSGEANYFALQKVEAIEINEQEAFAFIERGVKP